MNNKKRLSERMRLLVFNPGFLLILFFAVLFFTDGINSMQHQIIGYDEGWNATVAANYARHGEYRVSYPFDICFYNLITTGTPVILPTAMLYRVFGVGYITSALVPLIYMTLAIVLIWFLFGKCLETDKQGDVLSAILVIIFIISDGLVPYISTHLVGESACIFFLTCACILFAKGHSEKKSAPLFLAGAFISASFLTKSSMIFFVVSLAGIATLEWIIGNLKIRNVLSFLCGMLSGFAAIDSFKYKTLGGFDEWSGWWIDEWWNMMGQSGETVEKPGFGEKFAYLDKIFGMNRYVALIIVLLPVVLYLILLVCKLRKRETKALVNSASYSLVLWGVAASSLEIYYLLFGGEGLMYDRRHAVNEMVVRLVALVVVGKLMLWTFSVIKEKNKYVAYGAGVLALVAVFALPSFSMAARGMEYIDKKTEDDYDKRLMEEYLAEVDKLDPDASLYCYGWWQEPDVSLFLEKDMTDLDRVDRDVESVDGGYLLIGRRFDNHTVEEVEEEYDVELDKVIELDVDYSSIITYDGSNLFSIYKIREK